MAARPSSPLVTPTSSHSSCSPYRRSAPVKCQIAGGPGGEQAGQQPLQPGVARRDQGLAPPLPLQPTALRPGLRRQAHRQHTGQHLDILPIQLIDPPPPRHSQHRVSSLYDLLPGPDPAARHPGGCRVLLPPLPSRALASPGHCQLQPHLPGLHHHVQPGNRILRFPQQ